MRLIELKRLLLGVPDNYKVVDNEGKELKVEVSDYDRTVNFYTDED